MSLEPVLIAGEWRQAKNPADSFRAKDPRKKQALPQEYPVSGRDDVMAALQAGKAAADALRSVPVEKIAQFLEQYADNIEARADELVEMADTESALGKSPRLRDVELPRTTNQLRLAAAAARDRSWCLATIDTQAGIRSMYRALGGPVVVMGPNNFPYAFNSAAGGDFAAAVAAGNPIIAKANTSHPGTTKIFAEAAFEAVQSVGLPDGMIQLIYRTPRDVGLELVSHPLVAATGFTGSKGAGLKLKEAAEKAGKPIYLEMSSVNPVFVLPGALRERLNEVADELFSSCTLGAGQFCTNPGVAVVVDNAEGQHFVQALADRFGSNPPGTLLGESGPRNIADAIETLTQHGAKVETGGEVADGPGYAFQNTVLSVPGQAFIDNPEALQTEAFGAVNVVVLAEDVEQMRDVAAAMEGQLTGGLYSHSGGEDDADYEIVEPVLRERVGRLLNDKMPTGVAVSAAMNHGGPYPATGHPGFTAVGIPWSLLRFGMLASYDNVRSHRLPEELRDENPTGEMWRFVDGAWSQGSVS